MSSSSDSEDEQLEIITSKHIRDVVQRLFGFEAKDMQVNAISTLTSS